MNFTGFNNASLTFNDSASLPRESLDHVYDRNNAYSAVFDQHSSGHFVSSQDPGNSHRHAHDFLRSGLKAGANQLIDETEVVTESVAQHKYSQLANASYTYYNSKGDAAAVHKGLDRDKNYIWTIATSALQEVDRQLQAEKTKVASLEARISALENN